jgi:hypothetical protein
VGEAENVDALHVRRLRQDVHRAGRHLERQHRRDARLEYAQCRAGGISLPKAANRCKIVLDTLHRRHRFLKLPEDKKATAIAGIAEVDERYFLKSRKGRRLGTRTGELNKRLSYREGEPSGEESIAADIPPLLADWLVLEWRQRDAR